MNNIIILAGKKKTGKGSVFEISKEILGHGEEFFFAKPIKDFCINALGLTYEQMYGTTEQRESLTEYTYGDLAEIIAKDYRKREPEECLTSREVVQILGHLLKQFNPQVWVKAGVRQIFSSKSPINFFTDTRFEPEISVTNKICQEKVLPKPIVIRLYRETGLIDNNISETALDKFDAISNQTNINQGLPDGFEILRPNLAQNITSNLNPFDYILDNNSSKDETKKALAMIYRTQL